MSKTKYVEATGELYYARLFEQNIDDGEQHDKTQGQFNTIFIPENEEELERLQSAGFPEVSMGHKQIKTYEFAGDRLGMKLKRPNVHHKFEDMGGPPTVFDWTDGISEKKWDFDSDGQLGNGTKVKVKISIYKMDKNSTPTVRLEKVAVLEHVPFEPSELQEVGW